MIIFAELILLAIWCLGLRICAREGMILDRPHLWAAKNLPPWLYNPVIGCVFCMASIHGAIIHFGACWFFGADPWLLPVVIIPGVALNGFAKHLYEYLGGELE